MKPSSYFKYSFVFASWDCMRNSTPVGGGGKWASGAIWWLISTFSVSWLCRPHLLFWLPPHTFRSPWGHCLPGLWENFGNLPDTLLYFEKWLSVKSAVEWCVVILYVPPEGQGAVLWVVQGTWSYGPWWRAGNQAVLLPWGHNGDNSVSSSS